MKTSVRGWFPAGMMVVSAGCLMVAAALAGTPSMGSLERDGVGADTSGGDARTGGGHPTAAEVLAQSVGAPMAAGMIDASELTAAGGAGDPCGVPPNVFDVFPQFLPPLATGEFVNFESPVVKPLALSADGGRLYAANTPNNSLVVLDTTGGPGGVTVVDEIPVGLEPTAVAVHPTDGRVWVANHVSDNVSIVDVPAGRVVGVVEVGDEPVNVFFDPTGAWAFVVVQGPAFDADFSDPLNAKEGNLVVVDASTQTAVSSTFLDMNTPRGAVYDPANDRIVVSALHSGNNTTIVGEPVFLKTTQPPPPNPPPFSCDAQCNCLCIAMPLLQVARDFPPTATVFAATLGPWPDPHDDPVLSATAPLVQRIVPDAGINSGWTTIVDILADPAGNPRPAMVTQMNAFFGITNAAEVITTMAHDVKDSVDHDLVVLDASNPGSSAGLAILSYAGGLGTTLTQMARRPTDGGLFVANLEARTTTRLVTNLRGHFIDHEIVVVPDPLNSTTAFARNLHDQVPGFDDTTGPNPAAQAASLANPVEIVFSPDGQTAFVAALGSSRVGALDGATADVIGLVDVGRGPRGLALDDAGQRLYVLSRTDLSVDVVDVSDPSNMAVVEQISLFNPEPEVVQEGRDFLYSVKFTNNYGSSCALCHVDATLDHNAWDLGNPTGGLQPAPPPFTGSENNHPLKGPMVTMTLRGLVNHRPYHWRGDKPAFQDFNEAFDSLMGGSQLDPADMDAYTAFIDTVVHPPNPFYNRDLTFKDPDGALCGLLTFMTSCNPCHQTNHGGAMPGSAINPPADADVGGDFRGPPVFAQIQLVTQLRGIHRKFQSDRLNGPGLIHDGREERDDNGHPMITFLKTFFPNIPPQGQLDMISFVSAFPSNVMPVVGWQVELSPTGGPGVPNAAALSDISVMMAQHAFVPSRCDVTAKGVFQGQRRGFFLAPGGQFESDLGDVFTLAELAAGMSPGDSLVFTAVPPGSGRRIGVDQDADCLSDGVDPLVQHDDSGDANFDGLINVPDFNVLVMCSALDSVPLPVECRMFDSDCNQFLDSTDFDAFVSLFQGPLLDCNANGQVDLLDILNGVSSDANANAVPDECQPPISSVSGSRYLSVTPTGVDPVAILVTSPDFPCLRMYADLEGFLVDTPVFLTPAEWGTVQIGDWQIVPSANYQVQLDRGAFLTAPAPLQSGVFGNPDGSPIINIFDLFCVIDGLQGVFEGTCTLHSTDQMPEIPDRAVTLFDLFAVLDALAGVGYGGTQPCQ